MRYIRPNRDAGNVTSARAHAALEARFGQRRVGGLVLRAQRLQQAEQRPAVFAVAAQVFPVDRLGLRWRARPRAARRRGRDAADSGTRTARCRPGCPRAARRDRGAQIATSKLPRAAAISPASTSTRRRERRAGAVGREHRLLHRLVRHQAPAAAPAPLRRRRVASSPRTPARASSATRRATAR